MRRRLLAGAMSAVVLVIAGSVPAPAASAAVPRLKAGVGKADITPQTGYALGGWTRADRTGQGAKGRLFARALVLERGGRKVALVQADLFMMPGGMLQQIGQILASRGFSERNILISATHTHSGPAGFANFPTLNTLAPSVQTVNDPLSFARLIQPRAADPMLYTFLTRQISTAIRRADDDRGQATAGWGSSKIVGLTQNRSLEAHLADHGVIKARGQGRVSDDPGGYTDTIDPDVNVLRVDKLKRVRVKAKRKGSKARTKLVRVPIGGWSSFANHGTVNKSEFQYYTEDHQGSAMRVFEDRIRKSFKVPAKQEVLNVFSNSDEGDTSAGLDRSGPAASDYVGRVEGEAMVEAWNRAKRFTSRTPALDTRWTRVCFCGQEVQDGQHVSSDSQTGIPFLTGSEEGRGPLFDVTGKEFEDQRAPVSSDPQGDKITFPGLGAGVPHGLPLLSVRLGTRMIASIPGEATKEVGTRIRSAVRSAVAGSGIKDVVLSGLANEFILYITTPEEYDRQHYEGGNTQFGRQESNFIKQNVAALAGTLARGQAAPAPYAFDPTNGVIPNGPAYGPGAASGTIVGQPAGSYARMQRATFAWVGGAKGLDRPVDGAFVTAQRLKGKRWIDADDDRGLNTLWHVDVQGRYDAQWEIPRFKTPGVYRLMVTAKRYRLASRTFRVYGNRALTLKQVAAAPGRVTVSLVYPAARDNVDLSYRPHLSHGGSVRFKVGSKTVTVKRKRYGSPYFSINAPAGTPVSIPAGAAKDSYGNANSNGVSVSSR